MDSKIQALLQATLSKTEGGGLEWQAFDSESFRTKIGVGYLHIQRGSTDLSTDGENFYPHTTYSIQVSDAQGRIVAEEETVEYSEDYRLVDRLFQIARKAALKTDHVLEDMLHSLRTPSK